MLARGIVLLSALAGCRGSPLAGAADAGALAAPGPAAATSGEAQSLATFVARPAAGRRFAAIRPAGEMVWVVETDGTAAEVVRITVTDGFRVVVARAPGGAALVGATPSSAFYAQACEDKVCLYEARTGGAPTRLVAARAASGFTLDDDAITYTERAKTTLALLRAPRAGRAGPTTVTTLPLREATSAAVLALDRHQLYVHLEGVLWRVPLTGGKPAQLASGVAVTAPLSDGLYVYWLEGRRIRRVGVAGGDVQTVAQGQDPAGLVADSTHLYWVDGAKVGPIRRLPKRGGPDEAFAVGGDVERVIAVDGAYVYSIDATTHALQRSAK